MGKKQTPNYSVAISLKLNPSSQSVKAHLLRLILSFTDSQTFISEAVMLLKYYVPECKLHVLAGNTILLKNQM